MSNDERECNHTGFESNVCEICGYPDPSKMIAKLKDRCAGYCNGQEQLQSILSGVMDSNAKWAEEVATLKQQVEDMKCCGNCMSFVYCKTDGHIYCEADVYPFPIKGRCDNWIFDGMTREARK